MDYGEQGMTDTIEWIVSRGWMHAGAGVNLSAARKPAILTYGKTRVVLLSYNERPPSEFYATEKKAGTAPLDIRVIREDILKYKRPGTVIVVNPHWGQEMTLFPRKDQRITARVIIEMGADAVIGQHPHCPQGAEMYNGKIIFYSIGNFITGFSYPEQTDNIAVALHISGNSEISRVEVLPVAGRNEEIKFSASLLKGSRASRMLYEFADLSRRYGVKMRRERDRGIIDMKNTITGKETIRGKSGI
jgi:poly-gamma-glutamate synthesis protein (capsule biosynthesis protein)